MIDFGLVCSDASTALWGVFDFSIAPPLLFYAYVPIIVVSLVLSTFVLSKDHFSARSKLLFGLSIVFALLLINEIITWIAAPASLVEFTWQLILLFRTLATILTISFVYVFIRKTAVPFSLKMFFSAYWLLIVLLIPTSINVAFFDLNNCEGVPGRLFDISHVFEMLSIIWTIVFTLRYAKEQATTSRQKNQNLIVGAGASLFLLIFLTVSVWGDLTQLYDVALVGPVGMLAFMIFLAFIIVRYNAFSTKLIGAQALVVSLVILLGSQFFFIQATASRILMAITLVVTGFIGVNLIRSVKKEIEQREHIEQLALELEKTNERQEGLLHFIGHEVKGFLTKDSGAFAALVDGDFGTLPQEMRPFVEEALVQSRSGARSVTDILTASNQKRGTIAYTKAPFNLAPVLTDVVEKARLMAEKKGLTLTLTVDAAGAPYTLVGDKEKIAENVLRNVIENAIYYTPSGSVKVSLAKKDAMAVITVEDTGVGISEEDKKNLFVEGGHGKESQKINVHSTGYGLYIAKNIVTAHSGTITATSEGEGKGSTFTIELPRA